MKRIMISGTHSGCGKTTVTCAVLQALVNRGMSVSSFKCGPDYIDPMFHSKIIGIKSRNLDSRLCDTNTVRQLLKKNALDISVIEGVMGYYDGVGEKYSSCQTAADTLTPAVIVIDCKGMSLSMGAVMKGFLTFHTPNNIAGFIFNRLPESLTEMAKNLCTELNTQYFGRLPYDKECMLESRHLGLVTADEIQNIKEKTQRLAVLAEDNLLLDKLLELSENVADFACNDIQIQPLTDVPVRIAAAYDSAFCFYYEDNFDMLRGLGCEIVFFSPTADKHLPDNISGLIIGGGYPELYAKRLSENRTMLDDIYGQVSAGLPTIAECGGFMYLHKQMEDNDGNCFDMAGIIDGKAFKTARLQHFGYVTLTAEKNNLLCGNGGRISAHEFHYWNSTACGNDFIAEKAGNGKSYMSGHGGETLYAGFPHLYFYAAPEIAERFVKKCMGYKNGQN